MNNINGGHTKTQTDKSTVAPAVGPNPKPSDKSYHSCDTQDTESNLPPFTPNHRPGIYAEAQNFMTKAVALFSLFLQTKSLKQFASIQTTLALVSCIFCKYELGNFYAILKLN